MYVESCGLGPSPSLPPGGWEHSQVTVERDGRISATTGACPHGQRNEATFAQMLADQFGVPLEHVTIHHGDTAVVKQGIGTFGSRAGGRRGGRPRRGHEGQGQDGEVAKFAAALLEAHDSDLMFENGTTAVKGAPASAKAFGKVAAYAYRPVKLPEGLTPGTERRGVLRAEAPHVSVWLPHRDAGDRRGDPRAAVAEDGGGRLCRSSHQPLIVEGQVHGGLAQAMIEEVAYGADGQPLTASFMDYALPRASDFPRFELDNTVTPTPVNPLSAKGGRGSRDHRLYPLHSRRCGGRPGRFRRGALRHDVAAREAVAHSGASFTVSRPRAPRHDHARTVMENPRGSRGAPGGSPFPGSISERHLLEQAGGAVDRRSIRCSSGTGSGSGGVAGPDGTAMSATTTAPRAPR